MKLKKATKTYVPVFIAIIALAVSVWQGIVTREHNRLSMTPNLVAIPHMKKAYDFYGISIDNNGVGPAILKNITVTYEGKTYNAVDKNEMEKLVAGLKLTFSSLHIGHFERGMFVAKKDSIHFFGGNPDDLGEYNQIRIRKIVERISIKIEYYSIYKEDFTSLHSWKN